MEKKQKVEAMLRINSRITKEQKKYIKELAKIKKMTEGETHRLIINYYINKNKLN